MESNPRRDHGYRATDLHGMKQAGQAMYKLCHVLAALTLLVLAVTLPLTCFAETSTQDTAGEWEYKFQRYASMAPDEIVAEMTLPQKAAQMVQPILYKVNVNPMRTNCYGSIYGDEGALDAASWRKQVDMYQKVAIESEAGMNYMKQVQEDGSTLIVVLDSTSRYGLIRIVMKYMSGVWLAVLILYIIIMGRYSRNLVQPFIENDEKQKRFITNASHELKTPLAVISANTEMNEALNGKNKWTESTRRQVGKLQTLIEDLVVLSRLDEMRDVSLAEMDLSALMSEIVESFRDVIECSGKQLIVDIEPSVRGKVDKQSFQQLVSILMDNATKYCDEEGKVEVRLVSPKRRKGIIFTVSNTYTEGKNVDYSRFFERFYREDASHNSTKAGFGIGLSMGKEIVERLDGKIKVSYAGDVIL